MHALAVSEPDDATYKAMVQFADSILNLADIARQAGRAPQWAVIEHVTTGQVLLASGDHQSAQHALSTAITLAETHQLPHQIQRAVRLAGDLLPGTTDQGRAALVRLNQQLTRLP